MMITEKGGDFVWGNFRQTSNLGARHQTRKTSTPPTLGALWTIGCVKLWQAQILNNTNSSEIKKKEQSPGWLSTLKEALARGLPTGLPTTAQQYLATTATEDAQGAGSAPNCATKFRGENVDTKLKNEFSPTNLYPDEDFRPRCMTFATLTTLSAFTQVGWPSVRCIPLAHGRWGLGHTACPWG